MSCSEEYKEHIAYMFNAFCKVVLRNAALGAYRDFGRKHEVSLHYLLSNTPFEPFTTDNYFEQHDNMTVFVVKGQAIIVASERLDDTLSRLSAQRRTVLLMYFFLGYTDKENEYGRSRSTANYWKLASLKKLRKELEGTDYEE